LSPREIIPSFHRKSHFKALTSVFLKQGYGSKILNTEKSPGGDNGGNDADENKFIEKLMIAISKNQKTAVSPHRQATSISPSNYGLSKKSSMQSAGHTISQSIDVTAGGVFSRFKGGLNNSSSIQLISNN
jgi:hypothetical protein